jgi:hypothetical protein
VSGRSTPSWERIVQQQGVPSRTFNAQAAEFHAEGSLQHALPRAGAAAAPQRSCNNAGHDSDCHNYYYYHYYYYYNAPRITPAAPGDNRENALQS